MAPCAGNRSTPVPQAPPASSLRSSAPASGHPADACYRFRLHVSWPQTLSLSLLGRVCSLLPSGELTVKVSRELRQSLVASLLVSLSPVPSQVSAILMVLETWSQGHKNSPSRRWFPQPLRGSPRGGPGAPSGGAAGRPARAPPRGRPPGPPGPGPARAGAAGGPRGPRGHFGGFHGFGRFWRFWGVFGPPVQRFRLENGGFWGPWGIPRIGGESRFCPKNRKKPKFHFVPTGRVIKYPPKCTPPRARGGPRGPPGGPPGAPRSGIPPRRVGRRLGKPSVYTYPPISASLPQPLFPRDPTALGLFRIHKRSLRTSVRSRRSSQTPITRAWVPSPPPMLLRNPRHLPRARGLSRLSSNRLVNW